MKTLNLDELAKNNRQVNIKGTNYPVTEMSVEGFIEFSTMADELDAKAKANEGKLTPQEHIMSMVATIRLALSTCPVEILNALSIPQLTTLVSFLNGELDPKGDKASLVTETEEGALPKS